MRLLHRLAAAIGALSTAAGLFLGGCGHHHSDVSGVPEEVARIMEQAGYQKAAWGLRVVDLDNGNVIHDLEPDRQFLIGSVRKVFSVGELLDQAGPGRTVATPVHRQGPLTGGVLNGELVLVASGDLTMGGRTHSDGTIAISALDHNEANSLENATLTTPDPLAGFAALARQVAASGISRVNDVVIDDRLFVPFDFRKEFKVSPIFVNDDAIDVIMSPTSPRLPASVDWRPRSSAFEVDSSLVTGDAGTKLTLELAPELPACIGTPGCKGKVSGQLPVDLAPPLTNAFPLVRTFRMVEPANYARTVFIEALRNAGVAVAADAVAPNPRAKLPAKNSYTIDTRVAQLVSFPYSEEAKLILKVSYNIGADTSLVLFGLGRGVDNMESALAVERQALANEFGIDGREFSFVDGSGGGLTSATLNAVTTFLRAMRNRMSFPALLDALPILGVDGSLGSVHEFERDASLAGAKGKVFAKTGTFIEGTENGALFRAKAMAGYITARSGRRLAFALVVNDVGPISDLGPVLRTVEDQGRIAAILWRNH
jgi:D-alanyl-D-alanine carboxypeptidase